MDEYNRQNQRAKSDKKEHTQMELHSVYTIETVKRDPN